MNKSRRSKLKQFQGNKCRSKMQDWEHEADKLTKHQQEKHLNSPQREDG